jgi:hypothetical protein
MKYILRLETNFGLIRAVWHLGPYIQLFSGDSESASDVINVWDYQSDTPRIQVSPEGMATCVREWLWEMERGIEIETMQLTQTIDFPEADLM